MSRAIKKTSVVAFYNHPEGVKQSLGKLKKHGIDINKLSIAGKGYHSCSSLFIITGFGPIGISGPLAAAIVRGFGGGIHFKGLNALREGLCSIGVPKDSLFRYETALKNGICLVCTRAPVDKIAEVKRVFTLSKAIEITVHDQ